MAAAHTPPQGASRNELIAENEEYELLANSMLDALLLIRDNKHGESWSAGVAMSCLASLDERRQQWNRHESSVPRFLPGALGGTADRVSGAAASLCPSPPPAPTPAPTHPRS